MIVLALTLTSLFCSTELRALGRPAWVDSPVSHCPASQLCAVGTGARDQLADADARQQLAKVFSTQVRSRTQVVTEFQQSTQTPEGGQMSEEMLKKIEESTNLALKGVVMAKRHREEGETVYVFATLDRQKSARLLAQEIADLDDQVEHYYRDGRRSVLNRALTLLDLRRELHFRYNFLIGATLPRKVSRKQVLEKKRRKIIPNRVIFLSVEVDNHSGGKGTGGKGEEVLSSSQSFLLRDALMRQLLEDGLKVVADKKLKYDLELKVRLRTQKLYMNIVGFEKYQFALQVIAQNIRGQSIGTLETLKVAVGRSRGKAYEKVIPQLRKYLEDNLFELNIESLKIKK